MVKLLFFIINSISTAHTKVRELFIWRMKMKYKYILLLTIIPFIFQLSFVTNGMKEEVEKINTEHMDITGDKKPDTIIISGEKYEKDSPFYREIFLDVELSNGTNYHLPLEAGYNPIIDYVDLNNDGVLDVFITIDSGGSGGIQYYNGFSFKNGKLKDLGAPPPVDIYGQFLNNYKAEIMINQKTEIIDLTKRKKEYDDLGIYLHSKLSEPTELMVDEYSKMKISKNNRNKTILIGSQLVSGAYHADGIAIVESTWIWKHNKWNLIRTEIKPLI